MRNYAQGAALQPKNRYFPITSPLQRQNMPKMRKKPENVGLTAKFSRFYEHYFHYKPYGPENSQEFEQWAPPYSAQVDPSTQDFYDHTHRPNTLLPMCAVR